MVVGAWLSSGGETSVVDGVGEGIGAETVRVGFTTTTGSVGETTGSVEVLDTVSEEDSVEVGDGSLHVQVEVEEEVGDGSLHVQVDDVVDDSAGVELLLHVQVELRVLSVVLDEVQVQVELDVDDDMLVGFQVHSLCEVVDDEVGVVDDDELQVQVEEELLLQVDEEVGGVHDHSVDVLDGVGMEDEDELAGMVIVAMDSVVGAGTGGALPMTVAMGIEVEVIVVTLRRRGHVPILCRGLETSWMNELPSSFTFPSALPTSHIMIPPNHPFPGPNSSCKRPAISFTREAGR